MVCPNCGNALPTGNKPEHCPACGRQLYAGSLKQNTPFSKRRARVFGALVALVGGWKTAAMVRLCVETIRGKQANEVSYVGYAMPGHEAVQQPISSGGIWSKVFFFMLVAETCMAIILLAWGLYQLLNRHKEVPSSGTYLLVGILDLGLAVGTFCAMLQRLDGVEDVFATGVHFLMVNALCLIVLGVCYCIMRRRYAPVEMTGSLLHRNSNRFRLSDVVLLGIDTVRTTDAQAVLRDIYAMLGRDVPADAGQELPCILVEAVTPADAEQLQVRLTEAGVEVEVRPHNDPSK